MGRYDPYRENEACDHNSDGRSSRVQGVGCPRVASSVPAKHGDLAESFEHFAGDDVVGSHSDAGGFRELPSAEFDELSDRRQCLSLILVPCSGYPLLALWIRLTFGQCSPECRRPLPKSKTPLFRAGFWRSQRESNPCFSLERATS